MTNETETVLVDVAAFVAGGAAGTAVGLALSASAPVVALMGVAGGLGCGTAAHLAQKRQDCVAAAIARKPEYLPYIRASLTPQAVAGWYRHLFDDPSTGRVDAYEAPGPHAINFVVHDAQGGGINISPRFDAAAKSMGQHLLEMPVRITAAMARELA